MIERFEDFTSNIARAYKYIIKIKSYEMKEYGLKAAHVMCLYYVGKFKDGLSAGDVIELCHEDKAGVSKSLQVLREKGLVTLDNENGTKKYRAKYMITAEGKRVFDDINSIILNVVEECGEGLSDDERETFYHTLGIIVSNLERFCKDMETKDELN